jgi:predicted amidophosphoribosyltransferase
MVSILNIPMRIITLEAIHHFMEDTGVKRIHFETSHKHALKRTPNAAYYGYLQLPFIESINPILNSCGYPLFTSQFGGYWRCINNEDEYNAIEKFIDKYNSVVFLRDCLDMSLALSMNIIEDNERTHLGELEYQAKYRHNQDAENILKEECNKWIHILPFYASADYICAMPSKQSEDSLPHRIVASLTDCGFKNISQSVYWQTKEREVKSARTIEEKLDILINSNLIIADDVNIQNKTVVLFDDLYMSGVSMQYVGMKLKEKGASRVLGLTIVKSRKNTAL